MNISSLDRHSIQRVYFITGWNSKKSNYTSELALLKKCYPNADIVRFLWDSDESWPYAVQIADTTAVDELLEIIQSRPVEETHNTALVGHSLGARIAVRTVCRLRRSLDHLVLMGAAIDNNDPQIVPITEKIRSAVVHLFNPIDISLRLYKLVEGRPPLGLDQIPISSAKVLNVSTNGLFSLEEAGVFKIVFPVLATILGDPSRGPVSPLGHFLTSTHDCQRYLLYYQNRLNGRGESQLIADIQKFGDDFVGGIEKFISDIAESGRRAAGDLFENLKTNIPILFESLGEATSNRSDSGTNMIDKITNKIKNLLE